MEFWVMLAIFGGVVLLSCKLLGDSHKETERREKLEEEFELEMFAAEVKEELLQKGKRHFNKGAVEKVVELEVENERLRRRLEKAGLKNDD
jgi:hypothetical protein